MPFLVERTCTEYFSATAAANPQPIAALRSKRAYVLLGDPGSGKTEALKAEALETGGLYVTARDFITLEPKAEHRAKTIFIDALDESRAGEGDGRTPLDRIRARLDQLDRPAFRLSCRESDWLGESDRHALLAVAADGQLSVYHLDPLEKDQILEILEKRAGVADPSGFYGAAENRGLAPLLQNPQTLILLVAAVSSDEWPGTRAETFELACKNLVREVNAEHQVVGSARERNTSLLLAAAGSLCALHLLCDITEFSNRPSDAPNVLALEDVPCFLDLPIEYAIETRLFKSVGEGRFAPAHRSIAEFLAAKFLAETINAASSGRIISLMTSVDGGVVASLRGLHAWLAVHHTSSRPRLIRIDPLGVVLYGDVERFSALEKTEVFKSLHELASQDAGFRHQDWSDSPFGALATPEMIPHFGQMLSTSSRAPADEAVLDCALDAICNAREPLIELRDLVLAVLSDPTHWPIVRRTAMRAYVGLSAGHVADVIKIAEEIRLGKVADDDDELLGAILSEGFPSIVTAKDVLNYLHAPKDSHLIGSYYMFWAISLVRAVDPDDAVQLLQELANRKPSILDKPRDMGVRQMLGGLLSIAFRPEVASTASNEEILCWLGISVGEHGSERLDEHVIAQIRNWLTLNPKRHELLLRHALSACEGQSNFAWRAHQALAQFQGVDLPNMPAWWLQEAVISKLPDSANFFFEQAAIQMLYRCNPQAYDKNLEYLESWVNRHPAFGPRLQGFVYEEISDWRVEHADSRRRHDDEEQRGRASFTQNVREHVFEIEQGRGNPHTLGQLAKVYSGRFHGFSGKTGRERLYELLVDDELVAAVINGFKACVSGALPTTKEIYDLEFDRKEHHIRAACFAGLEELQKSDPEWLNKVSDESVAKALAFQLTYMVGEHAPDWFADVLRNRTDLAATEIIAYVRGHLKHSEVHEQVSYKLAHDEGYAGVARLAVLPILRGFPLKARRRQVENVLGNLLRAALIYCADDDVCTLALAKVDKSLDASQRLYWLAVGFAVARSRFEAELTRVVVGSRARQSQLAVLFRGLFSPWLDKPGGRESRLSYLIRVIGPGATRKRLSEARWVTPPVEAAELVVSLINRLAASPTEQARVELSELVKCDKLPAWHEALRRAQQQQRASLRDATFVYPMPDQVCATLTNRTPANAADLMAALSDQLHQLSAEIRHGNTDEYKQFWNVDSYGRAQTPRPEESCRDYLLSRLRDRITRFGVDAQPEGHYADDKRADIRVSYVMPRLSIAIPIEIKRDSHADVWTAMSDQLIKQYVREPEAKGRGIYVVFWFGGANMIAAPSGIRPTSAGDVQKELEAVRPIEQRELIAIHVVDCAKP